MLYFVTENKQKFDNASVILNPLGIVLKQKTLPIIEIQSHHLHEIAKNKAEQAFQQLKMPLVVKDDGWFITSLNGFPGSYMKFMNEWLTPHDFLRLIEPYENREIVFKDALYYIDSEKEKLFTNTIKGTMVKNPKGKSVPSAVISSFRKDGKTMAECINQGIHFADNDSSVWFDFAKWYKENA